MKETAKPRRVLEAYGRPKVKIPPAKSFPFLRAKLKHLILRLTSHTHIVT